MLAREGPSAFYLGATPAAASIMLESTVLLALDRHWKRALNRAAGRESDADLAAYEVAQAEKALRTKPVVPTQSDMPQESLCGGATAVGTVTLICPLEVVKVRLQNQAAIPGAGAACGPLATAAALWRTEGICGFYRGYSAQLCRDVPFYLIFFTAYEGYMKAAARWSGAETRDGVPRLHVLHGGGLANAAAYMCGLPFDVAKTVVQSGAVPIGGGGVWSTLWALCRADGLTRLFRGGWPLFWYGYVTGAAWWITVETVQAQMQCGKRQ